MKALGVRQGQIRITNQTLIVQKVREHKSISRSQLARHLQLSAPSISKNIDDLISLGIIEEVGAGSSLAGRKPIMVRFNDRFGYVIAIDMISAVIKVVLSDLSGTNFLDQTTVEDSMTITQENIGKIMDAVEELLVRNHVPPDKLLCICVGTPGVVDLKTGQYVYAPRVEHYRSVNLVSLLSRRFQTHVIVKNDVNCATLGEKELGKGAGKENFINIYIDMGTGAGIVINNKVFEGNTGAAGEIGLMLSNGLQAVENMGFQLEDLADNDISVFGLVCEIMKLHPEVFEHYGHNEVDLHAMRVYTARLYDCVRENDYEIVNILRKSAGKLAFIIRNLCVFLDIQDVILNGGLINQFGATYKGWVMQYLSAFNVTDINIEISELGERAILIGALGECVNTVINDLIYNRPAGNGSNGNK